MSINAIPMRLANNTCHAQEQFVTASGRMKEAMTKKVAFQKVKCVELIIINKYQGKEI